MRWRAIAMSAVAVLVACAVTFAQGRDEGNRGPRGDRMGPRGDRAGMRDNGPAAGLRNILDQLNLTDEQKQKYDEVRAEFDKKLAEARDKGGNPRDVYQGFIEEVKALLNEEQLKKFNDLQQQQQRGGGPGDRQAAMGMALMGANPQAVRDLNLTPEQQEKLRGLLQKFEEELKQLREKYQGLVKENLTPEQKEKFDKAVQEQKDRLERMGQGGPGDRPGRMGNQGDRGGRRGGDRIPLPEGGPAREGDAPPPPPPGQPEGEQK